MTDTNTYIGTDADTPTLTAQFTEQMAGQSHSTINTNSASYYRQQKIHRHEHRHDTDINSETTVDNNSSSN